MMNKQTLRPTIAALLLVLFVDGMSQGILYPILAKSLTAGTETFFTHPVSTVIGDWIYAIVLGVFFICWFFGAAMLGDLSDAAGRKKALMICLGGTVVGYIITALAFPFHSITLLILGRVIDGFTSGNQPIAQAAVIDISPPDRQVKNLGLILLAVTLGIIAGPIIGGVLSDHHLVAWFSDQIPMYFASLLAIVNMFLLQAFFHETFIRHGKIKIKISRAITIFISAFRQRNVRLLSLAFLFIQFGWAVNFVYISAYVAQRFAYSQLTISLFFALFGAGLAVGLAYFAGKLENRIAPKRVVLWGESIVALGIFLVVTSHRGWYIWLYEFILGMAGGAAYTFIIKLYSSQASKDQQGWVMGVSNSMMAAGTGIASLSIGLMAEPGVGGPLYFAVLSLIVGILIMAVYNPKLHQV